MAAGTLFIQLKRRGRTVAGTPVRRKDVYTGHDWKCQLTDPLNPELRQKVIERTLSGRRLILPPDAAGTFTYRGSTINLQDMIAWGLAKKTGRGYKVRHRKGMTAEIRFGSITCVLEYVTELSPEPVPEPARSGHLPVRYRFLTPDGTDIAFIMLLTLILAAHLAGIRTLKTFPIPEIVALKELPRRISRLILEPAEPPPPRVAGTEQKAGESGAEPAAAEKDTQPDKTLPEAGNARTAESRTPATREAIRSQVAKMGVVGVLTGRGTAGRATGGAGISVLQLDKELQQDLESVLGEISGITASASFSGTGTGADSTGAQAGLELLGIEGKLTDSNVTGPVKVSRLGAGDTAPFDGLDGSQTSRTSGMLEDEDLAPEQRDERSNRTIARVVAAHTGAIRYAYNRELRKKPSLRGKIVLTFTISPEGAVTECHIEESAMDWPPLENSLVKMVQTWKFPEIPHGDVTVSYPLVFFPSM